MKNTFGSSLTVTLFGESHGAAIGAVLDGMPSGVDVDTGRISHELSLRRPAGKVSTARREADEFVIESGVFRGKTTGTPICIVIPNKDTRSEDYDAMHRAARPGHADLTAFFKYGGYEDYRGGGHFSGRITAALVAVGAIVRSVLEKKGVTVATHVHSIAGIPDRGFENTEEDIKKLSVMNFPVLDDMAAEKMNEAILAAASEGDSVGGVLESVVWGVPGGVGEPWFDTLESVIAHALFSVPAVKGVEFGDGFALAAMRGSEANDPIRVTGGKMTPVTNHSGGILGGISSGAPIVVRSAVKPTATIFKKQDTVDLVTGENTEIEAKGRHDPCIVHRAAAVVNNLLPIVIGDMLLQKYGTEWLRS